jgi:hypothetical protein
MRAALPRDDGPIDLRRDDVEVTIRGACSGAPCARPVDLPEADLPEVDEDEVDDPTTGRAA